MKLTELDQRLRRNKKYDELLNREDDYAFQISEMIIDVRVENDLTQEQLAGKINTKQSSIARLENGNKPPSIAFLIKIAKALGMKLIIKLVKNDSCTELIKKEYINLSWNYTTMSGDNDFSRFRATSIESTAGSKYVNCVKCL